MPSETSTGASFQRLAHESGARLTLIDKSGRVLDDSEGNPQSMENHAVTARVCRRRCAAKRDSDLRTSNTIGVMFMYVAVPTRRWSSPPRRSFEGHQDGS